MYVITNSAMDFADGAQRFNWCACDNTKSGLSGLGASGAPPLFDFSFWGDYLRGGGSPTAIPAAGASGAPAAGARIVDSLATYAVPIGLALGAWYLMERVTKGGKRR